MWPWLPISAVHHVQAEALAADHRLVGHQQVLAVCAEVGDAREASSVCSGHTDHGALRQAHLQTDKRVQFEDCTT